MRMAGEGGVLTSAASDDTLPSVARGYVGHEVVGTPDLEAEDGLKVFTLEPYLISKPCAEIRGKDERGFVEDLVYLGGQDQSEVIWFSRREELLRREFWVREWTRRRLEHRSRRRAVSHLQIDAITSTIDFLS